MWFLKGIFRSVHSHHVRWILTQVLQHFRTPQCAGREGLSHVSSGALPGAGAHPPLTQGLSDVWFKQTVACSYRKAVAFLPTMSRQLLEVFQPGLASLLQGTHSTSHASTCRAQFTQSFNFLRRFQNQTKQNSKNPYRPSGKGRRCAAWGESDGREQLFIFLQQ